MCLMKANISGLILYKSADHNEMNFRILKLLFPSICKFRIGIGVRTFSEAFGRPSSPPPQQKSL